MEVACRRKIYSSSNRISGYEIVDEYNETKFISSDELKRAILCNKITVSNLKLTKDNRLIDTKPIPCKPITIVKENFSSIITKARLLNILEEVTVESNQVVYFVHRSEDNHLLIIPDSVGRIHQQNFYVIGKINSRLRSIRGNLKVLGGSYLTYISELFSNVNLNTLDLSEFNTCRVETMSKLFYEAKIKTLILKGFKTSEAKYMRNMFSLCVIDDVDFSNFYAPEVIDARHMFECSNIGIIDLPWSNAPQLIDAGSMFTGCKAKRISLKCFNPIQCRNMRSMFLGCECKEIILSSLSKIEEKGLYGMFSASRVGYIDLRSLHLPEDFHQKETILRDARINQLLVSSEVARQLLTGTMLLQSKCVDDIYTVDKDNKILMIRSEGEWVEKAKKQLLNT